MQKCISASETVKRELENAGFAVLDGISTGADFTIYRDNPENEHSCALIFVRNVHEIISPLQLVTWSRVASGANKEAILALVDGAKDDVKFVRVRRTLSVHPTAEDK